MNTHKILVLGKTSEFTNFVVRLVPNDYKTVLYQAEHLSTVVHTNPQLILIVGDSLDYAYSSCIAQLRKSFPNIPILYISKNHNTSAIIEAFRQGITDCLLFPFEEEAFLQILERYSPKKEEVNYPTPLRRIGNRLKKVFGLKTKFYQPKLAIQEVEYAYELNNNHFPIFPESDTAYSPDLEVHFFGKFVLESNGKILELLPRKKINALLAYLLYRKNTPIHRENLLSRFWGETSPSSARNSLNQAMHHLRRHINGIFPDTVFFQYQNEKYTINPAIEIQTDTEKFKANWQKGRFIERKFGLEKAIPSYQKASSFYRGDFLKDMRQSEWCDLERTNLLETYLFLLDRLGKYHLRKQDFSTAIKTFKIMEAKDSCLEDVHRKLILCYYRLGQRDRAIKQYNKCAHILNKELKINPSHSTRELFHLISNEKEVALRDWIRQVI